MIIKDIQVNKEIVTLKKTFKTSLRETNAIETIVVKIITENGEIGYGSAAPTKVITGETVESIIGAIEYLKSFLIGKDILNTNNIFKIINTKILKNTSAKAALDIAIYDLLSKRFKLPLYQYLGGGKRKLETDLTISINSSKEMVSDCKNAIKQGFKILKIKLGDNINKDLKRLKAINKSISSNVKLRIDANQGWSPKESIKIIRYMEKDDLNIELIEQPVYYKDIDGLKYVTQNSSIPILADESVFSPKDAFEIIKLNASDYINIKLMKTGGIYNALKIAKLAEIKNIKCMIGSMMENSISVAAAAHFAASQEIIKFNDLDASHLIKKENIIKNIGFNKNKIVLKNIPGHGTSL